MNITINGDIYITNYGQTLDELTEGALFDNCDTEEFCECECDEIEFINPLKTLIEEYAELLVDDCNCFDCIKSILENFVYDLIQLND